MASYLDFWNVDKSVFSGATDDGDIFLPKSWNSLIERTIAYSLQAQSLMTITGPEGTGKSSLARYLYKSTSISTHECMMVSLMTSPTDATWLSTRIASFLNTNYQKPSDANQELEEVVKLLDQMREEGRQLLVIVDGAEKIKTPEALEGIYNILQLQSFGINCISILLTGSPKVERLIENCPLGQYYSFRGNITPLSEYETWSFLDWKLNRAGISPTPFSEDASKKIYSLSQGSPRTICSIAEASLIEASIMNTRNISDALISQVTKAGKGGIDQNQVPSSQESSKSVAKETPKQQPPSEAPFTKQMFDAPFQGSSKSSEEDSDQRLDITLDQEEEPSISNELPLLQVESSKDQGLPLMSESFNLKGNSQPGEEKNLPFDSSAFQIDDKEEKKNEDAMDIEKPVGAFDSLAFETVELDDEVSTPETYTPAQNLGFDLKEEKEGKEGPKSSFFSDDWVEESKISDPGKFSSIFKKGKKNEKKNEGK